jgi:DNA-binding transcriptional ArsR family regulator
MSNHRPASLPAHSLRKSFEIVLLYLGSWLTVYMNLELALRALSNERRLLILSWLRHPARHFPVQVDGDLLADGVCGLSIARKLRVSQPTASEHLKILTRAGLIRCKRIKQWTFYKRDEARIRKIKNLILTKV